MEPLNRSYTT